jgi:hypothetical protein
VETITPREIERARAACRELQSNDPLVGLLPDDDDMPPLRDCDDPRERFADLDWTAYEEPDSEY